MPIPPDNRAAGDSGHVADHNAISDELTALAAAITAGGTTAVHSASAGSGTVTLDASAYGAAVLTLTGGSITLALTGATAGTEASLALYIIQSGGPWSLTWPAITWAGGTTPTLAAGTSIFTLTSPDGGTTWYGAQVTGAPALPLSVSNGGTGLASAGVAGTFLTSTGLASAGTYTGLIPPGTVQTSNFTATLGQLNEADATSGSLTVTLPAGSFAGQLAAVKMTNTASSHTTTIQATAPDVLGRVTGWTSGSYTTSASLALTGQGQLLAYNPAGTAWAAGFTSSSANITITAGSAPFTAGQVVYFTAGTIPAGLTANTPYYVVSVTGPASGVYTIKVDSTSTGTGIAPSSAGSAVLVQSCGNWTTVADDLPLSQLDTRYAAAGSGFANPMTTAGDLMYENATPAAARLPVGTDNQALFATAGLPAWGAAVTKLAATSLAGYAKVNGTGTILSWTAPSDGAMHRVELMAVERITSTETGGTVTVTPGFPDGTTATAKTLFTAGQAAGYEYSANASCPVMFLLGPATTITIAQQSALTAGASTVWAELWGS